MAILWLHPKLRWRRVVVGGREGRKGVALSATIFSSICSNALFCVHLHICMDCVAVSFSCKQLQSLGTCHIHIGKTIDMLLVHRHAINLVLPKSFLWTQVSFFHFLYPVLSDLAPCFVKQVTPELKANPPSLYIDRANTHLEMVLSQSQNSQSHL